MFDNGGQVENIPRKSLTGCIESLKMFGQKAQLTQSSYLLMPELTTRVATCDTGTCSKHTCQDFCSILEISPIKYRHSCSCGPGIDCDDSVLKLGIIQKATTTEVNPFNYQFPALAGRSYLTYNVLPKTSRPLKRLYFSAVVLTTKDEGILAFLHGTESYLCIFLKSNRFGFLLRYYKNAKPIMYHARNLILHSNRWYRFTFFLENGMNNSKVSMRLLTTKNIPPTTDEFSFTQTGPYLPYHNFTVQNPFWLAGTPEDTWLADNLDLKLNYLPFDYRKEKFTDLGWTGAVQDIQVNNYRIDKLFETAKNSGNTSPFRGHDCDDSKCKNGFCKPRFEHYQCECEENFTGNYCQRPEESFPMYDPQWSAKFTGQYVNFTHNRPGGLNAISLKFKTFENNGMLIFQGNENDFAAIGLLDNRISIVTNKFVYLNENTIALGKWNYLEIFDKRVTLANQYINKVEYLKVELPELREEIFA